MLDFSQDLANIQQICFNLVELLQSRALHQPQQVAYRFLADGETETAQVTYAELDRQSRAIASHLQSLNLSGERALLLYPPGLDYLGAFFGCLYAKVVAVPAYPPRNARNIPRIQAIASDAKAAIALTNSASIAKTQALLKDVTQLQWLATDNLPAQLAQTWKEPLIEPDTLAFLQYTSGSTGTPKGVMLTHGNLLHNSATTYECMEHSAASVFVSWLPTYHDMGLIGGILQPLYGGFPCILMPPAAFLQSPYRWLQAISRYRGTTSGAPNFAYQLCIDKITAQQRQKLDLSSWDVAFNGAEPIRAATLAQFSATFASCGFRHQAFYPCYGLAEASLMVTGSRKSQAPVVLEVKKTALEQNRVVVGNGNEYTCKLVSCGQSIPDEQIAIAHPDTKQRCLPGEIGEIWVSSPSVGQGYWQRKAETVSAFQATIPGLEKPFLRTGDLGFLHQGELFVTSRAKDLIIIRGRNLYPQDIELTAEQSHPCLRRGSSAAFSIEVGNEELVVVQEVEFRAKPNIEEVASAIRQAIAQEHEVQVYGVVLIKAGSIPKTSSGKIQRRACKSLFLADKLDCLGSSILEAQISSKLPGEDVESCLQAIVEQVLQIKPESDRAIASFGLDSLKVFELKNAIESNFGVDVPVAELFADISIAQLASKIRTSSEVKRPLNLNPASRTYELSFAQERLWFLEQLEPENLAYNLAASVNLTGKLDLAALKQSLNAIIQRHEILRTKFEAKLGKPYQIVVEQQLNLDIADISDYSEQETQVNRLLQEIARSPFDLHSGCLLRAKLVKLASNKYILLLGIHHIIFDGWSTNIFLQELATLYAAFSEGKTSNLAELPIQYADFASWQRQWLQAEVLETQTSYWKQQLKDLSVLSLHTDFPRLSVQSYRGARQTFKITQPVVKALTQLSQQENTTLFITLLTAFKILLHRYTSNEDIAVGSAIANRNRTEVEGLIGFFVNTLVLRTNLEHNPSFWELLQKVKNVAVDAYTHQDLPFEQLVKELQPQRNLSHNPLVQVMVDFQQAPPTFELPDLSMQLADMEAGTGKFDLTLSFLYGEQGLLGSIEYNACLFKETTIARMSGHLQTLLADIVTNCDRCLSDLSLITKEEHQQLLEIGKWGVGEAGEAGGAGGEITIHSLFEAQVERSPDTVALVFEEQQLTYAELNNRANQLANYLQILGVGAEVLVGICVERSPAMLIGILAILKAGGAYVPLDPTYPQERLAFMLNDSQVPLLLTQQHLQALLPQTQAQVICIDTDGEIPLNPPCNDTLHCAPTASLAYVIYTSGSTGKPKGVAIQHNSVANFTQAASLEYGIEPGDRILQFASLSFDTTVEEIFPTLVRGATLVLRTDAMLSSMATFVQKCSDLQITVLDLPTAFWQQLTRELATGKLVLPKSLRLVIIGGEKALPQDLAMWRKHTDGRVRLLNTYGPTETTVVATVCDLSVENTEQVPIGRAISNVQTYVLDRYLQPVPIGIPGELYIGGVGVARGYLNQPELTQAKFIPNPFNHSGDRLYKTGDIVCYREDGNLEFHNRIDNQVKIRGFRIELDEVEAVLVQYPTVKQAVAIAKEQRLVAYIVGEISKVQLQNFLKQQLPEYMIPNAFVVSESLPLLPNGKVDRQALLALDAPVVLDNSFISPRTPEEQLLADCWAKVLGVEKVGIDDNFFELGGHSLLATQLIAQVQATFAVDLPLNYLFQFPTVASLSAAISQIEQIQSDTNFQLPAIVPAPQLQYQPFPLNEIQQAYWIGRSEAFELGNIATHGYLEVESIDLDLERFNLAWQRLIERHQMLRAIFLPDGQQQILEQVPPYQIQILDLRGQKIESVNAQLQAVREAMSHQMLACDRFPLFDIRALLLDERRTRLHFSMDGLIADAWSYQIIGRELAQLYANPDIVLPEIEISFRDYVVAELAGKNSYLAQRSLEYWQNRIPTLPPAPELPLIQNPASVKQPCFKRRSGRLNSQTWLQLKTQATVAGVTATELLLAAFAEVLAVWSKNPQFTICLTLFNRLPLHPQVNEVVGEFTALNLLAVDNSQLDTFATRVKRLQAQLWQDIDHRYISGVQVLRELIRIQGRASGGLMPVVFTSTLHQDGTDEQTFPLGWLGDRVYELTQTSQVLLDVQVAEEAGELVFNWDAVEELFPTGLLDEMFAAYSNLLESLVSSQSWQTMPQLVPAMQVVVDAPASEQLLHTLVAKQVQQCPEQVAVVSRDRTLSYQQLWQLANQLGQQLRELGVCPNQLVAVVMEKGWEQVVGVLGVLLSGAAYVPIDPSLPEERRSQLLDRSGVKVVVTQSWLEKCQHVEKEIFVDCLDGNGDRVLEFVQQPDDLAYVIYTSGSTGMPKGVAVDHRGAVNTILDVNERFGVNAGDRVLALSALSFDLSVYDIFGTLAAGGTIVMPDDVRDPGCWAQLLVREGVTIWNSVPALMQMMVEYAKNQPSVLASLRLVLLSGDWLPLSLPSQLQDMVPGVEVVSLGGATEASIWSILYPVSQVDPSWKSIPYGKAMLNQHFYVLNHALEVCPVWVSGHLYIGGVGLAQGYWQDTEKTNASFIVHPRTGERLYRTGDLGRYLPDGNIEFLGREDFQVKVGGYRIELGEVESALVQHDAVKEVVVLALGEQHKQLVAFVVCQERDANISSQLRCFLADKLPAYMIPVRFVVLDVLPLTPNGKLDRQALAKLDCSDDVAIDVAPRTDVEIALAEIWGKILGLSQVGINGNFFQMGGDSLLATQVISQVRDRWNIDLPLRSLFEFPDIARFSGQIEQVQSISAIAQDADKSRIAPVSRSLYRKKYLSTNV